MNSIFRAIPLRKRLLSRSLLLQQSHYATTTTANTKPKPTRTYTITKPRFTPKSPQQGPSPKPKADWPRPSEVPFQPKVANSVNLIGHVHTPLQLQPTRDGNFWAATILTTFPSSSQSLRIPIIFEGDLAHTANLHLKDNDCVFIAGNLRSDLYHLNASEGQTRVQVMVHTLNFVQESSQMNSFTCTSSTLSSSKDKRQEERTIDHTVASVKNDIGQPWKDLLAKPQWDIRLKEDNSKAAFERKDNGELHRIDYSTPESVQPKLDSTTFNQKSISDTCETSLRKDGDSTLGSWRDLLDNPKDWCDYRKNKLNGLVKPNYPDFKRKDGGHPIWLDKAPQWVLSELEGMEFDVQIQKSKQVKEGRGDASKAAAFERKDNVELHRIDDSTAESVQPKLDSRTFNQKSISDIRETHLRKDGDSTLGSWRDLLDNPKEWWDYRKNKLNGLVKPHYPDFKHKDGGHAIWLNKAPQWVLSELEGMEFDVQIQKSKQVTEGKGGESWKDLVENPDKWWDNRLRKLKEKSPDFKHKETGEALWLSSSPTWVLSKLPPLKSQ